MTVSRPPALPVDDLRFSAKIDYATLTNGGIKIPLPPLTGVYNWVRPDRRTGNWVLTIQDPTPADLRSIAHVYENPMIMAIEVAVDLMPKTVRDPAGHAELLATAFAALAGRFRPEGKALWDYGQRGAVNGPKQKPQPLERRFARPDEQVVYGHRGDFMQAKLYLKTMDQGVLLPESERRVRMEVALRRLACMEFGLANVADLFGYPYRAKFTTQFRVVDRPEVRLQRGLTEAEFAQRTKRMMRAWRTAGVAKFAVGQVPRADILESAVARVRSRERAQLPADHFKLLRDQNANAKIGAALVGLQRRMKA